MRKLKFRAYDTDLFEPQMVYSNEFNSLCIFFSTVSDENLMQFTGLTDKNGVDIYESDVVRFKYCDDSKGLYVVIWSDELSKFCFSPVSKGLDQGLMFDALESPYTRNKSEIIGNIHQNKDLLG